MFFFFTITFQTYSMEKNVRIIKRYNKLKNVFIIYFFKKCLLLRLMEENMRSHKFSLRFESKWGQNCYIVGFFCINCF
jgi:hypothetical protein